MPRQHDLPEDEIDRILDELDLMWTRNVAKVTGWMISDEGSTG